MLRLIGGLDCYMCGCKPELVELLFAMSFVKASADARDCSQPRLVTV